MADEKLPIKLFSKREDQDERRTEGGGSGDLPNWVLPNEELIAKAGAFRQALTKTAQVIATRPPEREFIPAVVRVAFKSDALAKGHRAEIGRLFNRRNEYNFIGLSEDLELLLRVDSAEHLAFINQNLEQATAFPVGISAIEEIEAFSPEVELPADAETALKIKLVNYQDRQLNNVVERVFEQDLAELGIEVVRKTKYSSGLTVFKIRHVRPDALEQLQEFEALYSITPMPNYSVGLDGSGEEPSVPVKEPIPGQTYPTIGMLDSGIAPIAHLRPWLEARRFTVYDEEDTHRGHGTFVAGVALYGDELERQPWVNTGAAYLLDATVFPNPQVPIDEDELIENIQNAVRRHSDVKIWNLSLGSRTECHALEFSDFGKALDALQEQYDVLICKSAGNCDNFKYRQPKRRIPNSADSIRSLVVGSIAHAQRPHDLARVGYPSPFSRTGFGPNNLVKPDLTHYGGNGGLLPDGTVTQTGVSSFSITGGVVQQIGTSFSTPRVTALLAGLNHRLAEDFDPLLLKALLIHSAKYPADLDLEPADRLKEMGYGRPGSLDEIIYNTPHEITLILRDTIVRSSFIEIFDFPFPDELVNEDGQYYGEVILTLVAGAKLDGTQGAEYCQSNIKVAFGTYDTLSDRDMTKPGILNPNKREGGLNVLLASNYAQRFQRHLDNPFTPERQLRSYQGKFHPVKKYAVNLGEMTESKRRNGLTAPKRWFLKLEGLFAQAAEIAADQDGEELSQDFALIITIRDPRRQHDVYSSVTRSLVDNNFQHSNVRLRNEVQINLRNSLGDSETTT
ncbi:S8 family peptidase [Hymenobacter defluvii]|uniref:S8 family peptidase n=1 Tax=Hymenobacter defluvii TaxID=2054411 RepID=A0ABS3TH68_9BACT|nr:S8 family peptidase [Hymenobacter defluvii]MBO3272973.1 S8 family peptidase [Hymenobacter defluvii]